MKLDFYLVDEEFYPTVEFLQFIENFKPVDLKELNDFIVTIRSVWYHSDYFIYRKKYKGVRKLELHTAGWSGNASIIDALMKNFLLINCYIKHVKWEVGGHYFFEIKLDI